MSELRYRVLMASAVAVLAVVLFGRLPGRSLWLTEVANFAHGPAFAVVTLAALAWLRHAPAARHSVFAQYAFASVIALALGVAVELVQMRIGRDAEVRDVWRDALGVLTAFGVCALVDPELRRSARHRGARPVLIACGAIAAALLAWPLVQSGVAYRERSRAFPVIADFSGWSGRYFLAGFGDVFYERARLPSAMSGRAPGAVGLRVVTGPSKWWGLFLREPHPDWRGHDRIAFSIANPTDAPLVLQLRIHDTVPGHRSRDGFVGTIEVAPGVLRAVAVPLAELKHEDGVSRLDTGRIHSLILARSRANRAPEFYLTRVWLE